MLEAHALSARLQTALSFYVLCHSHGQLESDRVHLAFDQHRSYQLPDMMDAYEVILEDVRSHTIVELEYTIWSCVPNYFLVLNRTDCHVVDLLELEEVVDLAVVGALLRQEVTNEGLLAQCKHLVVRGRGLCNDRSNH